MHRILSNSQFSASPSDSKWLHFEIHRLHRCHHRSLHRTRSPLWSCHPPWSGHLPRSRNPPRTWTLLGTRNLHRRHHRRCRWGHRHLSVWNLLELWGGAWLQQLGGGLVGELSLVRGVKGGPCWSDGHMDSLPTPIWRPCWLEEVCTLLAKPNSNRKLGVAPSTIVYMSELIMAYSS